LKNVDYEWLNKNSLPIKRLKFPLSFTRRGLACPQSLRSGESGRGWGLGFL